MFYQEDCLKGLSTITAICLCCILQIKVLLSLFKCHFGQLYFNPFRIISKYHFSSTLYSFRTSWFCFRNCFGNIKIDLNFDNILKHGVTCNFRSSNSLSFALYFIRFLRLMYSSSKGCWVQYLYTNNALTHANFSIGQPN